MQLLINDYTYDHPERDRAAFLQELREELAELGTIELQDDEIPEAVDVPVVLAAITTVLGGLFFAGKRVEENLDAWLRLGSRLLTTVRRLRERFGPARVDGEIATILALVAASEIEPSTSWELLAAADIPLRTFPTRAANLLTHHPNAVFVRSWRAESGRVVVVLVKSTGESSVVGVFDYFNFE